MQLNWWRVCLDEAQMIESGVSQAAMVAELLSRENAWAITGTPIRKDVNDLRGLLIFLRHEPFASRQHVWQSLIATHKPLFATLVNRLVLRHTKQTVRNEVQLPAQRRYVITMPFTPVEEENYQDVVRQLCDACGLGHDGIPLNDPWSLDNHAETMRQFLTRLRQTALHPELSPSTRVQGKRPVQTVPEVINAMLEDAEVNLRADQRSLHTAQLKRGQLYENTARVKEAQAIWLQVATDASGIVDECRQDLEKCVQLDASEQAASTAMGASDR